jgi:hypothetical protein
MSVMEARIGARRAAARNAAERRKKLILVGLVVVMVGLLAFQLPKLLKRGESSATSLQAISTTSGTTAGSTGALPSASAPAKASEARVRAIRRLSAKDPFVPLIRDNPVSASTAPAAPAASRPRVRHASEGAIRVTVPKASRRAVARALKPNAAALVVNGRRQVVGVREAFGAGDITFRLVSVTPKTMRLRVLGGAFAGGKRVISVRKGHRVTLVNTATGVKYSVRFSAPARS